MKYSWLQESAVEKYMRRIALETGFIYSIAVTGTSQVSNVHHPKLYLQLQVVINFYRYFYILFLTSRLTKFNNDLFNIPFKIYTKY